MLSFGGLETVLEKLKAISDCADGLGCAFELEHFLLG